MHTSILNPKIFVLHKRSCFCDSSCFIIFLSSSSSATNVVSSSCTYAPPGSKFSKALELCSQVSFPGLLKQHARTWMLYLWHIPLSLSICLLSCFTRYLIFSFSWVSAHIWAILKKTLQVDVDLFLLVSLPWNQSFMQTLSSLSLDISTKCGSSRTLRTLTHGIAIKLWAWWHILLPDEAEILVTTHGDLDQDEDWLLSWCLLLHL